MPRLAPRSRDVFVFRIGQLGDTLVALPAIQRIAQRHPDARLWLITNGSAPAHMVTAWDVLRHTGLFHGVLFYDTRDPLSLLRIVARARLSRGALLYYLTPPRSARALRRDRLFFHTLCGFKLEAMQPARLVTPRDADGKLKVLPRETDRLVASLGGSDEGAPQAPWLVPPPAAVAKATRLLSALAGRPIIALGPGSKMPAKRWFLERYLAVCERIVQAEPRAAFVVLGGAEDAAEGAAFERALGTEHVVNAAGQTNIIESAAVLARCGLYLGNDTGTMHLAASMGVPCVALFTSRENRDTWYPWGDDNAILRRELPCSGCMLERCDVEKMRCLDLITVDDVWAEVAPRLARLGSAAQEGRSFA